MESKVGYVTDLNLKATELRLGLPGTEEKQELPLVRNNNKRPLPETSEESASKSSVTQHVQTTDAAPPAK